MSYRDSFNHATEYMYRVVGPFRKCDKPSYKVGSRLVVINLKRYRRFFQYEAALAVDAVTLITRTLRQLQEMKPTMFASTLRHGTFYNNGTEGISCDSEPVIPWTFGREIHDTMKKVNIKVPATCFTRVLTP